MRRSHDRSRVDSKPDESDMDSIKLHSRPASRSAYPFAARSNPKRGKANVSLIIASAATLSVLICCCYAFFFEERLLDSYSSSSSSSTIRYSLVIDGGSTGTRIHVFGYRVEEGRPVLDFNEGGHASLRVNPGLSAYSEDPDGVGGSLAELVEFGKGIVPAEKWKDTEVRLMATAGLRRLELPVQERILGACRRVLRSSGFKFRDEWASVISGSDEGVYAWVVANYALSSLGGDPLETTGIIELGGASAQVTFVSSEPIPREFLRSITVGNFSYNLYSHSFLHFGQNVALDLLRESLIFGGYDTESLKRGTYVDPCAPRGYLHDINSWKLSSGVLAEKARLISSVQARGNFSECRSAALRLLQRQNEKCSYQRCYLGSVFMPKLRAKILATENFFHTSKFLGLGKKAILSDFVIAGEQFCGNDWSNLKTKYPSLEEEDLLTYCFSSAYIVALLHDSLGIALNDQRIGFVNQVRGIPLDWAFGAFILQTTTAIDKHPRSWSHTFISRDCPTLFYLVCIFVLVSLVTYSISKLWKPQLKTVFDMEKGRYIITRAR